jgi:two-component system, response regulator PdtaR
MTVRRPAALIVEDQPFVGMVASDILKESGFETFHAYDAKEAAGVLHEHPEIGVVITEAALPGPVDGLELARQLSRERPDVQLVVTSSDADLSKAEIPEGARTLRKPYASGELRTVVASKSLLQDA